MRGDLLIEIQTGNFAPLRRKLDELLARTPFALVAPVALTRRIVRISDDGVVLSARRSPKARPRRRRLRAARQHPGASGSRGVRARDPAHAPGGGARVQGGPRVSAARLGRRRPVARARRPLRDAFVPRGRARAPSRPASPVVRHGRARRGGRDRPPARAADDVLPPSRGALERRAKGGALRSINSPGNSAMGIPA